MARMHRINLLEREAAIADTNLQGLRPEQDSTRDRTRHVTTPIDCHMHITKQLLPKQLTTDPGGGGRAVGLGGQNVGLLLPHCIFYGRGVLRFFVVLFFGRTAE